MIQAIIAFLLCMTSLQGFELKSRIDTARKNDFIVYSHKSSFTYIKIAEITPTEIVIEEITAPLTSLPKNWQKWLQMHAPGHTSWTKNYLNRTNFSLKKQLGAQEGEAIDDDLQFLRALFTKNLTPLTLAEQKKVGPEPLLGEVDFRPLWTPKIIFNEKAVSTKVTGYRTVWPDDGTELSGRLIELYIPDKEALTYLPYWIQIYKGPLKFTLMAIDSGRDQEKLSTEQTIDNKSP